MSLRFIVFTLVLLLCGFYLYTLHLPVLPIAGALTCVGLLFWPFLKVVFSSQENRWPPWAWLIYICAAYLIYAVTTETFTVLGCGILLAYLGATYSVSWFLFTRLGLHNFWSHLIVGLIAFVPFKANWLAPIWTWPRAQDVYGLNILSSVLLLSSSLIPNIGRGQVGLPLARQLGDLKRIIIYMQVLGLISIPIGFATHFFTFNPVTDWLKIIGTPLGIFLFVAFPEELVFRGILLRLLLDRIRNPWIALVISALLFGSVHLTNFHGWNWSFTGLATIAGLFYGLAYMRTKNLWASTVIHTVTDCVWILLFMDPTLGPP